ncbi:PREDICTED: uncharacterized protein LOC107342053 [Acropora digitifera]|uniref:uncharacterized protein LOC107342053 n=1 Tax=Acropora digitifera TaxID=70779 RepID=UPI00077AA8E9|nr:PREDICTED: uncharacterized protein LOC107342053 [Acropora digitifera]
MAPVMVLNIDHQWVADLVEMQWYWRQNRGVRYLLTDVLSKYAWVRTIKRKTGAELLKAFENIVAEGRRPQTLQTDKGKEFYNATLQRWLKKEGIRHFSTLGDAKASIMERIGMAPKDVNVKNEAEVWQRLYGQVTKTRRRGRLKAGDKVRLSERVKNSRKATYRNGPKKCLGSNTSSKDPS